MLQHVIKFIYKGFFVAKNDKDMEDLGDGLDMLSVNIVPKVGAFVKKEQERQTSQRGA